MSSEWPQTLPTSFLCNSWMTHWPNDFYWSLFWWLTITLSWKGKRDAIKHSEITWELLKCYYKQTFNPCNSVVCILLFNLKKNKQHTLQTLLSYAPPQFWCILSYNMYIVVIINYYVDHYNDVVQYNNDINSPLVFQSILFSVES